MLQARRSFRSACPATLAALLTLTAGPAVAGEALWRLQKGLQACVETSQVPACRQAEAQVIALTRNSAYARSSHLCKEEISELAALVALLPRRDAVPNELMSGVADVQQACLPYGF